MTSLLLLAVLLGAQSIDGGAEALQPEAMDAGAPDAVPADVGLPDTILLLQAETAKAHLRGRVLAKGSRNPVVDARVSIAETQASTQTDDDGQFDLALDCGPQKIVVRASGYDAPRR